MTNNLGNLILLTGHCEASRQQDEHAQIICPVTLLTGHCEALAIFRYDTLRGIKQVSGPANTGLISWIKIVCSYAVRLQFWNLSGITCSELM